MKKQLRSAALGALLGIVLTLGGLGSQAHVWDGITVADHQPAAAVQNAYLGIQYASRHYMTETGQLILGFWGLYASTIQGAIWTSAFGTPVGIGVAFGVGA